MTNHEGCERVFVVSHEAYYWDVLRQARENCVAEVFFGHRQDGRLEGGELFVRWYELSGQTAPRLEVFSDGWSVLAAHTEVVERLGTFQDKRLELTPDAFCNMLRKLGFVDKTERPAPADPKLISMAHDVARELRARAHGLASTGPKGAPDTAQAAAWNRLMRTLIDASNSVLAAVGEEGEKQP